mmetsp:Transcript_6754/g.9818  ORF Transcript_6754/g.9818 Transcript_6754/m.9818 type:complete len:124 (-) Transcript_6754:45-416(-)
MYMKWMPSIVTEGMMMMGNAEGIGMQTMDFELQKSVHALMGTVPIRIKKAILFNAPWYMRAIMAIIRPFLSEKIKGRMQVVQPEELTNHFHPSVVEKSFPNGTYQFDHDEWIKDIEKCLDDFL